MIRALVSRRVTVSQSDSTTYDATPVPLASADHLVDVEPWAAFADAALRRTIEQRRSANGAGTIDSGTPSEAGAALAAADQAYDDARARFLESLYSGSDGIAALAVNARLTALECEVLALAIAVEIDARRQALVGQLNGDPARVRLTLQTVAWLLGGGPRCAEALGPGSGLRTAALIDIAGSGPWAQLTVVVPISLVWAFLGDMSPDPDLPYRTRLIERHDAPPHVAFAGDGDVDVAQQFVIASGPDLVRRQEKAMEALGGQRFLVTQQPESDGQWAALVREATMIGCAVVVELDEPISPEGRRWIDRARHLAWALTAEREFPVDELPSRPWIEIDAPMYELTDLEWMALFGDSPRTHRLTPQQAERAHKAYLARGNDLDAAVRRLLAGPLESLATRVRPRARWDDLILSPERSEQLRSIASRYRKSTQVYDRWGFSATPSRGLVTLFSGKSGTGKTLAAEVLAGELGLDMFKLDLSSVVSKYIGETEKNLDQLFDAAGLGNVVLFFDEADALFGKRSEVKDSRDRYANVEVSYLLQRVEAFDGVVVLATNFERSIDEAFLRRIHSRIEFALPEENERRAIWHKQLPPHVLLDDVDLTWLAQRFEFSGGQIRNACIQAAFAAAQEGGLIGMHDLVRGAAQELRKVGRLLRPETFGDWYEVVAD
jgi:AAA+ superfamily predicted ATPase